MAVPKRRRSKSKKRMHAANWKAYIPTLTKCTNCDTVIKPYCVCPSCGFYKGKKVIQVKVKATKSKED